MNQRRWLFILVVIQTMVLIAMIGMKQYTLNTGREILLETQPVDPRSLFRGDYVRLSYKISTLVLSGMQGDKQFLENEVIFVTLQEGDPYWYPVAIHHSKPQTAENQVAIKGRIEYILDRTWNRETNKTEEVKSLSVKYGIENYFVEEGTGRALERPGRDNKVDLRIAVDAYGNAGIKAVLVNGEEKYIEKLF